MDLVLGYHGQVIYYLEIIEKSMKATVEQLREILSKTSARNAAFEIDETGSMREQGIDSLDLMDLYLNIEDTFNIQIPDDDINKLKSLKDFETYVNNKL